MVAAIILIAAGLVYYFRQDIERYIFEPTPTSFDRGRDRQEVVEQGGEEAIKIIAENLEIPWEIVFLPDGDMLVTERPGTLRRIGESGEAIAIEGVEHRGEGGLLGLALHPDFNENRQIYLYFTTQAEQGLINRVERYRFEGNRLTDKKIIIDNIPGASYHDGGRIAFGPDGYLYITTGDSGNGDLAQDRDSLAGKILRLKDDGGIPEDNPFGTAIYSYGHRNPQGLAWDEQGRLWATEHGRSGIKSGMDELNLIEKGKNYGWPVIEGDETREGMAGPVIHSGPDETWAPAGAAYLDGKIFFVGLRGASLYEADINDQGGVDSLTVHLRNDFGRLRVVTIGPDGYLYLATSNQDGRGSVNPGDDKIIRINPAGLQ